LGGGRSVARTEFGTGVFTAVIVGTGVSSVVSRVCFCGLFRGPGTERASSSPNKDASDRFRFASRCRLALRHPIGGMDGNGGRQRRVFPSHRICALRPFVPRIADRGRMPSSRGCARWGGALRRLLETTYENADFAGVRLSRTPGKARQYQGVGRTAVPSVGVANIEVEVRKRVDSGGGTGRFLFYRECPFGKELGSPGNRRDERTLLSRLPRNTAAEPPHPLRSS